MSNFSVRPQGEPTPRSSSTLLHEVQQIAAESGPESAAARARASASDYEAATALGWIADHASKANASPELVDTLYREALGRYPRHRWNLVGKAKALMRRDEHSAALEPLAMAERMNFDGFSVAYNQALCHLKLGHAREARSAFERAQRFNRADGKTPLEPLAAEIARLEEASRPKPPPDTLTLATLPATVAAHSPSGRAEAPLRAPPPASPSVSTLSTLLEKGRWRAAAECLQAEKTSSPQAQALHCLLLALQGDPPRARRELAAVAPAHPSGELGDLIWSAKASIALLEGKTGELQHCAAHVEDSELPAARFVRAVAALLPSEPKPAKKTARAEPDLRTARRELSSEVHAHALHADSAEAMLERVNRHRFDHNDLAEILGKVVTRSLAAAVGL
ncbi:MAG: hypothetical protein ACKVPX_00625 [Myxococcaceae bacterium]